MGYMAMVGFLYFKQDAILFSAGTDYSLPAEVGLHGVSEVTLETPDKERLAAWYGPAKPGLPVMLFFHGKGGLISGRPQRYDYYTKRGLGLLAVEYRGYGPSTGRPSEAGFLIDAQTAHEWLIAQGIAPSSIVIVGESLGTAVATKLAARVQAAALLLEAPYSSVVDVAAARYWFAPVRALIRHQFNAIADVGKVKMPILIQHGTEDTTVPYIFGQKLFAAAPEPKEFVTVEGAGHMIFNAQTWAREMDFLNRHLGLNIPVAE
jgi:fermentation-respiration switch protein FrsA (DUF1100 family)